MDSQPSYGGRFLPNPDEPVYDQGLAFDLETMIHRRRALQLLGAATVGGLILASPMRMLAQSPSASPGMVTPEACLRIAEETAGPFPGDGSNGPDALSQSGVVRSDIRPSIPPATGTAVGVPLTIRLLLQGADAGCAPLAGAAVYAWHCDRVGRYSMYSSGVTDQSFLRGVQAAGEDGLVVFESIFPGCYPGRWPHVHFEVFPSLESAADEGNRIATSQLAFPEDACVAAYAAPGYEDSARSLSGVTLASDGVFGDDGGTSQLGTMDGDVERGFGVTLAVPVQTAA
jgi:protocatechuate 3,4-dioxygenase beta subunit